MENRPPKHNGDEVISPEVTPRSKSAKEGESFSCTICLVSSHTLMCCVTTNMVSILNDHATLSY